MSQSGHDAFHPETLTVVHQPDQRIPISSTEYVNEPPQNWRDHLNYLHADPHESGVGTILKTPLAGLPNTFYTPGDPLRTGVPYMQSESSDLPENASTRLPPALGGDVHSAASYGTLGAGMADEMDSHRNYPSPGKMDVP